MGTTGYPPDVDSVGALTVGAHVGDAIDAPMGDVVGEYVGDCVGDDVVGESVGDRVGNDIVGVVVGAPVAWTSGAEVGAAVG